MDKQSNRSFYRCSKSVMPRNKRKNRGPRSGKLHKALCEKDVNGRGKLNPK